MNLLQEDWIRKLVHQRCMQIFQAVENGAKLPYVGEDELIWMALEVLHLIPAGEWLEATRAIAI